MRERLEALQDLLPRGSARPEEVIVPASPWRVRRPNSARPRELEVRQILIAGGAKQQSKRHTISAPCDGVLVRLFGEEGEFIGPNDPQLMTVMQFDPLLATFAVQRTGP